MHIFTFSHKSFLSLKALALFAKSWQFYAWKEKLYSRILMSVRARSVHCFRTTFEPFIPFAVLQQPIFQKRLLNKTCDSKFHQRKEIDFSMQTICARNARPTNKFAKWICKQSLKIRQRNDIISSVLFVPFYASAYH